MFFSAKELKSYVTTSGDAYVRARAEGRYAPIEDYENPAHFSLAKAKASIKRMRKAVVDRSWNNGDGIFTGKWLRPWDVVPKLRNFRPPQGEYGIGIEVEMGFNSRQDASYIADQIKDWKYIAVDREGGTHPIEATFPPVLLSKFNNSQAVRYLRLLKKNEDRVYAHGGGCSVGTHVNVSSGTTPSFGWARVENTYNALEEICHGRAGSGRDAEFCLKYFGRERPYGTVYSQGHYLEYKLFNSTTSTKQLKKYVAVAVALTKMMEGDEPITVDTVKETLRSKVKA